jgi:hypothetical protein
MYFFLFMFQTQCVSNQTQVLERAVHNQDQKTVKQRTVAMTTKETLATREKRFELFFNMMSSLTFIGR